MGGVGVANPLEQGGARRFETNRPTLLCHTRQREQRTTGRAFDSYAALARLARPRPQRAKAIILGKLRLSARDALHAAVMERGGVTRIMSFNKGFDMPSGIARVGALCSAPGHEHSLP